MIERPTARGERRRASCSLDRWAQAAAEEAPTLAGLTTLKGIAPGSSVQSGLQQVRWRAGFLEVYLKPA